MGRPPVLRLLGIWLTALALWGLGPGQGETATAATTDASAGTETGTVVVLRVTGTIDLGLSATVERVLRSAAGTATGVIIEIDTPGGRLDAAIAIRAALLDAEVPTVAFITDTALSAGALVALASERIFMTPAGVIGAATPVLGATGETADAKTVSAVRGLFAATAEARGRDPLIAAAMVDVDVEIPGVVRAGELLTLTTTEARAAGVADAVVADRGAVLAEMGWDDREVREVGPRPAETLVRLITGTVVSGLLLLLGLLLVIGDVITEGFGLLGLLGLGALGLFFWGHLLAGLAGWEDVALVGLGIGLVLIEVLVLPGMGVAGVAGLLAIGAGAFLSITGRDWDFVSGDDLWRSGLRVAVVLALVAVVLIALLIRVGQRGAPGWLTLSASGPASGSTDPREDPS